MRKIISIISLMCAICSLCSFAVPTRGEFAAMTYSQRTVVLEKIWDLRYDIMLKSEADDVIDEFFCMYHELLLDDKEISIKENLY